MGVGSLLWHRGSGRALLENARWCAGALFLAGGLAACAGDGRDVTSVMPTSSEIFEGGPRSAPAAESTPIVFRSDRDATTVGDLYLMAPDGSNVRRLTEGGDFYFPAWSPQGDSIACRWMPGGDNAEVALVAPDGSPPVQLTVGEPANFFARPVQWSPDGQRLAFASSRDGALRMWVTSRSGSQQERLLPDFEAAQEDASWSRPDGSEIAYAMSASEPSMTAHGRAPKLDIWLATSDGASEPVNLTQGRVARPSFMRWSPDGTRLAFSGYALAADGSVESVGNHADAGYVAPDDEIFVIDVATRELRRLTDNAYVDQTPAWSPDGRALLISSYRDGDGDVWFLPVDAPDQAYDLIDDGEFSGIEDHLADWYLGPAPRGAK